MAGHNCDLWGTVKGASSGTCIMHASMQLVWELHAVLLEYTRENIERVAQPSMIQAGSCIDWPPKQTASGQQVHACRAGKADDWASMLFNTASPTVCDDGSHESRRGSPRCF